MDKVLGVGHTLSDRSAFCINNDFYHNYTTIKTRHSASYWIKIFTDIYGTCARGTYTNKYNIELYL